MTTFDYTCVERRSAVKFINLDVMSWSVNLDKFGDTLLGTL